MKSWTFTVNFELISISWVREIISSSSFAENKFLFWESLSFEGNYCRQIGQFSIWLSKQKTPQLNSELNWRISFCRFEFDCYFRHKLAEKLPLLLIIFQTANRFLTSSLQVHFRTTRLDNKTRFRAIYCDNKPSDLGRAHKFLGNIDQHLMPRHWARRHKLSILITILDYLQFHAVYKHATLIA